MENFFEEKELKESCYFAKDYIDFINECKTEKEVIAKVKDILFENKFKCIEEMETLNPGDKVFFVNKDKSMYIAVIGEDSILDGLNIVGSHVDSPRIDLRPNPIYENNGLTLFKTHYYGGIKKYQWTAIPLSMHGVIYNEKGEKQIFKLGDNDDEPVFTITDLLPHLAEKQMDKPMKEAVNGEELNILVGKEKIEEILKEKYEIERENFEFAEIEFVPELKAKFVGFDQNLIGGYGQDDRSCVFTSLKALLNVKIPKRTCVCILADKEEIGSYGNTSMSSNIFDYFINQIIDKKEGNFVGAIQKVYLNSVMLSADVNGAYDPNYPDVFENNNAAYLGKGVNFCKYTGSKGKSGSSEANVEFMIRLKNKLDENNIKYQFTEMGKLDIGGGGTIAFILADKGIDVIDCGLPLLSMHSPYEIIDKNDLYEAFKNYKIFFEEII